MGTWRRLEYSARSDAHRRLLAQALAAGVQLVDTSPMYGQAEKLLAEALGNRRSEAVIATKIWTPSAEVGKQQLAYALGLYGGHIELVQIHNLVGWMGHLSTLESARDN